MDYDALVRRHKDAVYRQMIRACGNRDDAEDVLVEALVNAYRALPQLEDEKHFQAWLAMIGRRLCSKFKHRESLRPVLSLSGYGEGDVDLPDEHADVEHEAEMERLKDCVSRAISKLPPHFQEVYVRRELEGRPAAEVGRELGLTVANVKSRLHRARHMVRSELDRNYCLAGTDLEHAPEASEAHA